MIVNGRDEINQFPKGFGTPLMAVDGQHKIIKDQVTMVMFFKPYESHDLTQIKSGCYHMAALDYAFFDKRGGFVSFAEGSALTYQLLQKQRKKLAIMNGKAGSWSNEKKKQSLLQLFDKNIAKVLIHEMNHGMNCYGVAPNDWRKFNHEHADKNQQYILSQFDQLINTQGWQVKPKCQQWLFYRSKSNE